MKGKLIVLVVLLSLLLIPMAAFAGPYGPPWVKIEVKPECGEARLKGHFRVQYSAKLRIVMFLDGVKVATKITKGPKAWNRTDVMVFFFATGLTEGTHTVEVFGSKKRKGGSWNPRASARQEFEIEACPVEPEPEPAVVLKPVCPMQLLTLGADHCLVLTEGGVAVHRQPAICGWVADNQSCGGMVYDDGSRYGQWRCDRFGYWHQPIVVLRCLWQRHLDGKRDPESRAKCLALGQ